jgi:hypothetical protein
LRRNRLRRDAPTGGAFLARSRGELGIIRAATPRFAALYPSQQALVTARLNQLTGQVDLYRALGDGWRADGVPGSL